MSIINELAGIVHILLIRFRDEFICRFNYALKIKTQIYLQKAKNLGTKKKRKKIVMHF